MSKKDELITLKNYLLKNNSAEGIYIDQETLNKILNALEVKSLEEIQEPSNRDKYNVSSLKEYLRIKGISNEEFAKTIGVSKAHIYRILNGSMVINQSLLNRILELFDVESYEKLNILVTDTIQRYNDLLTSNGVDIVYLKQFLKEKKITNKSFMNYLEISKAHMYRLFNNELDMNEKYINKIFELYDSKELIDQLSKKKKTTKISNGYDISFLKKYLKNNNITQLELANYIGIKKQYMSLLLNKEIFANKDHLNKILDFFKVNSYEELQEIANNNLKVIKKTSN